MDRLLEAELVGGFPKSPSILHFSITTREFWYHPPPKELPVPSPLSALMYSNYRTRPLADIFWQSWFHSPNYGINHPYNTLFTQQDLTLPVVYRRYLFNLHFMILLNLILVTQYDFPLISEDCGERRKLTRMPIAITCNSCTMSYIFMSTVWIIWWLPSVHLTSYIGNCHSIVSLLHGSVNNTLLYIKHFKIRLFLCSH